MIIIADSGSTETSWVVIENYKPIAQFNTIGLNPYFTKHNDIIRELNLNFPKSINQNRVEKVFFYGAGCSTSNLKRIISNALHGFFVNSYLVIESDMLAASRALFQNKPGIALILGTGANTCLYNGIEITKNIKSLGYILGDEGGGDYLGKIFIQALLNKELPKDIENIFYEEYALDSDKILHSIYKEDYPNRYLASFTKFIKANIHVDELNNLVKKSFVDLFTKHITKYQDYTSFKIRATGSIAFYFKEELKQVAQDFKTKIDLIKQSPLDLLIKYHIKN